MPSVDWKQRYLSNTLSSYANFLVKTVTGFLIFRQFFDHLDATEFGFWSLIWSFIGYSVILDFGMGFTIQKFVAIKSAENRPEEIDALFTTTFWTFVVIGAGLFLIAAALRGFLFAQFDIPPSHEVAFSRAYFYFAGGMALLLPLGLFPAALAGIQRLDVCNWLNVATTSVYFIAVMEALKAGWAFDRLMLLAMSLTCLPALIAAGLAFPMVRAITLRPSLFDISRVRGQLSFSLIAYCISSSNILLKQIDRVVLAKTLGLGTLTLYQPGLKVAEMLGGFSSQLMNAVSPAAAQIHASGQIGQVRDLLFRTSRLLFIITTPCYLLAAFYMEPLLCLLTSQTAMSDTPMWAGHLLLLAIYVGHLTATGPDRVLMMCGQEKIIFQFTIARLVTNLVFAIVFALWLGPIGVAAATLASIVIVNFGLLIPRVLRFCQVSLFEFIAAHVRETAGAFAVFGAILAAFLVWLPCGSTSPWSCVLGLAWRSALVMVPTLWILRRQIQATWRA